MHAYVSLSREVQVTINPLRVWNYIMLMLGRVGLGAATTAYFRFPYDDLEYTHAQLDQQV
jgi:hypothetical protein